MHKVFYRYIARSFWSPFGLGLGVFFLLLIFGSLFDKLGFFMKSGSNTGLLVSYILYQTPYFLVKVFPLATLLAVLFSLGGMIARGEWKAGLAGGWRPFDMLKPLLVCSVLAGAGQFALQETVAPGFFLRSEYIFRSKLRAQGDWRQLVKRDVTFSAGEEVIVTARLFDGKRRVMEGVILNIYKEGRLFTEVNARSARWRDDTRRWVFSDGVFIKYDGDAAPSVKPIAEWDSDVSVPPENLVLEKLVPDGVSSLEVLRRLRQLSSVGSPSTTERTLLWVKLAAPLANPVMALIGAAMVLMLRKNSGFLSFGLALCVGFLFWAVIIMTQSAGKAELLPPVVAGLAPCVFFTLVSLWGLKRVRAI